MQRKPLANGLFHIKEEEFYLENSGKIVHRYKAAGDIGWARECQYIQIQCIIDRIVENAKRL